MYVVVDMDKTAKIIEKELITIYQNIGKVLDEDCIYDHNSQRSQNLFQHLWEIQNQISLLEGKVRTSREEYEKYINRYYIWLDKEVKK